MRFQADLWRGTLGFAWGAQTASMKEGLSKKGTGGRKEKALGKNG